MQKNRCFFLLYFNVFTFKFTLFQLFESVFVLCHYVIVSLLGKSIFLFFYFFFFFITTFVSFFSFICYFIYFWVHFPPPHIYRLYLKHSLRCIFSGGGLNNLCINLSSPPQHSHLFTSLPTI